MRKFSTSLFVVAVSSAAFAQRPQKMNFQAVIRNTDGDLVKNSKVGIRISILQGSVSGTMVYTETQNTETNVNGLITIAIGEGTALTDNISSTDWSNDPYFIKTETDPAGETNYTITGASELLSVPYALYAANGILAPGSVAGNTTYWNGSPG
jgi:hypothetical protein